MARHNCQAPRVTFHAPGSPKKIGWLMRRVIAATFSPERRSPEAKQQGRLPLSHLVKFRLAAFAAAAFFGGYAGDNSLAADSAFAQRENQHR
jgi:hypothetical protein